MSKIEVPTNIVVAVDGTVDPSKLSETLAAINELETANVSHVKIGATAIILNLQPGLLAMCGELRIPAMADPNKPTDPSCDYPGLIGAIADQGYEGMVLSPTMGPILLEKALTAAGDHDLGVALALSPPNEKGFWHSEGGFIDNDMTNRTIKEFGLHEASHPVIQQVVATTGKLGEIQRAIHPDTGIVVPGAKAGQKLGLSANDGLVIGRAITSASSPEAARTEINNFVNSLD